MNVTHNNTSTQGSFILVDDGTDIGEMTYTWRTEKQMVINHTEVDEAFEGQGGGKLLVEAAVEYARGHKVKITPVCSYAKHVMEKDSSYADVLA